jgi:hypothetical protein
MVRRSKRAIPAQPPEGTETVNVPPTHEEWLLDESLAETFPASDPIAPARTTPAKSSDPEPRGPRRGTTKSESKGPHL